MSNPTYQGPGQPRPSTNDGLTGWLGGFLGGTAAPAYKSAPTAPPSPPPCPPCLPCPEPGKQKPTCPAPTQAPVTQTQTDPACEIVPAPFVLDECGDAVIPVGSGPITIVIQPRA
jgi:hypothetical protein